MGQSKEEVVAEVLEEQMFVVRLYDMFDGWIDVTGPLTWAAADAYWQRETAGGARMAQYGHGDYYRVFPAGTRMLHTPESRGR